MLSKTKKKNDFQVNPKEFFVSEANFNKIDTLNLDRKKVSFLKNLNPPFFLSNQMDGMLSQWSYKPQLSLQEEYYGKDTTSIPRYGYA